MAAPPPIHPSAPPSPAATSTSIPVVVGISSLPSTTVEQEPATAGTTVIQVDLEQQEQTPGGEIRQQRPSSGNGIPDPEHIVMMIQNEMMDQFFSSICGFKCWKDCFMCAWNCVQLWMPLSVTFFIYWLIYRPDSFHPRTDSAVLSAFDLTNDSLEYDLAIDLSFRNSHRLAISYLDVAASVFYNGTRLGPTDDALPSFIQGRKNTTVVHPAFHGVVAVDSGVAAELHRERTAGIVHLRVTVSLTLMYKVLFISDVFFYKYDCWLWFPPPRNHTPAVFHGDGNMCWRARV